MKVPIRPLQDREYASRYLANHLNDGTLILAVGAGATSALKFPNWEGLIRRILEEKDQTSNLPDHPTAEQLQLEADRIRISFFDDDHSKFAKAVRDALYRDFVPPPDTSGIALLQAVSAMVRHRPIGGVSRVVVFNFDSVMEWHSLIYGIPFQVINNHLQLERADYLKLYHPHGYLPHPEMPGNSKGGELIVLDASSVDTRLGKAFDDWRELLRRLLRTGMWLFIGMSMESTRDHMISPLLREVGKEVQDSRPVAFWTFGKQFKESDANELSAKQIVPLYLDNHEAIPTFLLSICQNATALTIRP